MSNIPNISNANDALRSGEIEIVQVALYPRSGDDYIDIQHHVAEINLFGSIYSTFYSATLSIVDNIGLLHSLPIVGEETIVITVKSSSWQSDKALSKVFKVYAVKDFVVDGEYNNFYNLELISIMGHVNNLIHINKKFSGNCTHTVMDIVQDYMKTPCEEIVAKFDHSEDKAALSIIQNSFDKFLWRPRDISHNRVQFVANNWTPAYTINWIAERALIWTHHNDTYRPDFIFNEGMSRIVFQPLSGLSGWGRLEASPAGMGLGKFRYEYLPTAESRNPAIKSKTIIDVSFKRFADGLRSQIVGGLASSLESYDVVTKRYHKQNYDWVTMSKDYAQLERYQDVNGTHYGTESQQNKGLFHPKIPRSFDTKKYSVVKHNQLHNGLPSYLPEQTMQIRRFMFASLEHINLEITVYGNFDIEAGGVVHLTFPVNKMNPEGREARYITGYYLVLGVRHKITQTEHFTYLEVAKESTQMREFEE